jgi:molecular chaperone DnaJ
MSAGLDYYAVLGVDRGADERSIKAAYRKLALELHPDRNPGDRECENRFKAVNEAYSCLSDAQKRAAYDRYGHAGLRTNGASPADDFAGFSDIFSDIFDQFMGGGGARTRGRQGPQRGADVRYDLEVSFEDAFHGSEAEIALDVAVTCDACLGTGGKPGARPTPCTTCGGRGSVRMQNGMFIVERTCPSCHGAGSVISDPCDACHGAGRVERRKSLKITIPRGVDDGTRIRLAGEGEAGPRGGTAGDLYIFVHMKPHPIWKRDGTTLFAQVPMSFVDAALGNEFCMPGIDGADVRFTIPPGTQSGRQFRVRGRGMPALNGAGVGDLVVQVDLETPVKLSARQKELLEEFQALDGDRREACPKSRGFWERLKESIGVGT